MTSPFFVLLLFVGCYAQNEPGIFYYYINIFNIFIFYLLYNSGYIHQLLPLLKQGTTFIVNLPTQPPGISINSKTKKMNKINIPSNLKYYIPQD